MRDVDGSPRFAGPRTALVIGSSMGLGLASRIALACGGRSETFGVCHERAGSAERTASAGWYNAAALHEALQERGANPWTLVGDAFSLDAKARAIAELRQRGVRLDLLVYSLASRQRQHPDTGQLHVSSLKAVGQPHRDKALNPRTGEVFEATLPVASERELADTISVMGGEDWQQWLAALDAAELLSRDFQTVAFSYVGPQRFMPTYRHGTIGRAKEHLEASARGLQLRLCERGGQAHIAVMAAFVTQSSLALPMGILYSVLLARILRERNATDTLQSQCWRLFANDMYGGKPTILDAEGRIRLDSGELDSGVQLELGRRWDEVNTGNLAVLGDVADFNDQFQRIYGFNVPEVDYDESSECMPSWATQLVTGANGAGASSRCP